jgi:cytochrome c biogenesis protein CcmG/thiol:disulfide interchange protein DsbE
MKNLAHRFLPFVLASLSTLATLGCGSTDASGKGSESAGSDSNLVGNPAPDFSLKAVTGGSGTVSLKSLRGKVVLVDFWGTFCEPCKKSFPKLQDLNTKFSASGLKIVGVSEDEADDKDKIPDFADTYGAKFTLGWDEDKTLAKAYKPPTMPSTFLIDRKGVVRFAHVGYHDGEEAEVEKEIKELLGQ